MISEGEQTNSKNLYKIEYEDSRGIGGCRTKNSPTLWQGFMHLQWNCFHIFTNKRGTYGIIADGLRFATQLSNVYGNAIRAKLAAAQTMRSVAGLFSSFVTQNLQSICSLYHRHPRFFHKSSESDSIANVGIPAIRHAPMPKAVFVFHVCGKVKEKKGDCPEIYDFYSPLNFGLVRKKKK